MKIYGTACRDPDGQWRVVNRIDRPQALRRRAGLPRDAQGAGFNWRLSGALVTPRKSTRADPAEERLRPPAPAQRGEAEQRSA
jgi:hypothetical protein